jgi:capsular polysaccharide biosynthesis protein
MLKELFDWLTKSLALLAVLAVVAFAIVAGTQFGETWYTGYQSTFGTRAQPQSQADSTSRQTNGLSEQDGAGMGGTSE